MNRILGLDLGTNSIGWALRNLHSTNNQIEKFGVITFSTGVGKDEYGRYTKSYAAERTKKRSTRRLYQARKYRLWATLEHLIIEGYCPLSIEDLNRWRYYNKEEARKNNNAGRIYPVDNAAFDAWIKLDFNNDGKPDYTSPYQLRKELAQTKLDFAKEINRFKLGRALYHIAQRRGFKSSRKSADDAKEKETTDNEITDIQYSEKKKNKVINELFEKYPQAKTIGWLFAIIEYLPRHDKSIRSIAKFIIDKSNDVEVRKLLSNYEMFPSKGNKFRNELNEIIDKRYGPIKAEFFNRIVNNNISIEERIRENITQYAIRENYKEEIKYIFQFQELGLEHPVYVRTSVIFKDNKNKNCIGGTIFYKRPLRSQKGLIGLCTLEQGTRIDKKSGKQIQVGKYRAPVSHPSFETFRAWAFLNNIKHKENNEWKQLPLILKQEIYQKLFFRKSKGYFPFSEIVDFIKDKGKHWELNYKPKTTVTACPVSARLKDIFGDKWNETITKKDSSGKVVYVTHKDHKGNELEKIPLKQPFYQEAWHVLFSYEDQEYVAEFAERKLNLEPEKVKQFVIAWNALPVGYGMLSINAINKINTFLEKGLIYTEAVLLANIPEIIGKKLWQENEKLLLDSIGSVIDENRQKKTILNIANNLVSKHKNLETNEKFGGNNYRLAESDLNNVQTAIEEQFGINKWNGFHAEEKKKITDTVKDCYQAYFTSSGLSRKDIHDERHFEVKSNNKVYYKSDSGYYRLPKLIDTLGEFLQLNFNVDDKLLSRIYHPSEINIYPPAKPDKDGVLKLGSPKTGSFKNPMAMRTLHELRKLMNYLIETNQIDNETRLVVEVARELNDTNKRWAIETWQRQREAENQEFEEAIKQLLSKSKDEKIPSDDIDKVRLFYEQNTEQTLPSVAEENKEAKGKKKKLSEKDEAVRWSGHGKKLIDKYRLWKEQGYQCLYTGKYIKPLLSD